MASKLYGVDATIIIFVFVLYCIVLSCLYCSVCVVVSVSWGMCCGVSVVVPVL